MTFQELAQYFDRLEETSSRLILIDILAELFSQVREEEVSLVCYLLQGRVAPFYEATEIGMSEKNVAASIARAYNVEREAVLKEYGKVGDLGKIAQQLSGKREAGGQKLSVDEVFNTLREIAQTQGDGTVE